MQQNEHVDRVPLIFCVEGQVQKCVYICEGRSDERIHVQLWEQIFLLAHKSNSNRLKINLRPS